MTAAQPTPSPRQASQGWPAWVPYVVPFAAFMALLVLADAMSFLGRWEPLTRAIFLIAILWVFSRDVVDFRIRFPVGTLLLGIAVFLIWIAPDILIPGYREHWLFQNSITGKIQSSVEPAYRGDALVLALRAFRAVILVPIIEELFWRGFLMRWLIRSDFQRVPLGAYTAQAMWISALLFASEHGAYWEVGLIAGLLYNWWMVRTRSLGDCILAHAVTNGVLSAYVLIADKWEYWM